MRPTITTSKSVLVVLSFIFLVPHIASAAISSKRQAELIHLLKHDCGSCHGMTLQGGLGPALTVSALAGKPATFLRQTVLDGRRGTAMPPWRGQLTEAEAAWLVERLLKGEVDGK